MFELLAVDLKVNDEYTHDGSVWHTVREIIRDDDVLYLTVVKSRLNPEAFFCTLLSHEKVIVK
jgi:hypothetical protein